jgi:hypothetical protein
MSEDFEEDRDFCLIHGADHMRTDRGPIAYCAQCDSRKSAPYGEWCHDPTICAGKGYCPRDPTCGD